MHIYEAVFFLVSHVSWKNILLMNANNKGSNSLVSKLNNVGKPVTVVGYQEIKSYPWPERLNLQPRINGYILMARQETNLTDILNFLKEKHLINPSWPWIIGFEGILCLKEILPCFREGDRVLILSWRESCDSRSSMSKEETANNNTSVWSLHSPGNGKIFFTKRDLQNLSHSQQLFEQPFKNFHGRTLKISSLASPPIRIPPKASEKRWSGYIFEIINTLADVFNFTYTVKDADNRLYGMAQEDGSWSGMIGELIKKTVDVGAGDLSWTLERFSVVDLTDPVFPETVTFIYKAPDYYSRTWILFQGIHPKVWIAMMSATIAAFAAYFLSLSLHRICRRCVRDNTVVYISAADESVSTLYRGLLGKGVMNVPITLSGRTVLGVWFVGSLILCALYGGSLTSKLSLHKSPKPADSLKELLKRHPNAMLAVRNNSQIHNFFKKSIYWKDVWSKNVQKFVIPGRSSIEDTVIHVHDSPDNKAPYVWIAERSMLVKMMQKYSDDPVVCDLYVAKEDIVRSDWSIALQRDSPFLVQFNEMIGRMERFGLLEKWRREYWEAATGSCQPTDGLNQSGETPITLDDTRAIFIVLAIGWAVGIVVLIIERRCGVRQK